MYRDEHKFRKKSKWWLLIFESTKFTLSNCCLMFVWAVEFQSGFRVNAGSSASIMVWACKRSSCSWHLVRSPSRLQNKRGHIIASAPQSLTITCPKHDTLQTSALAAPAVRFFMRLSVRIFAHNRAHCLFTNSYSDSDWPKSFHAPSRSLANPLYFSRRHNTQCEINYQHIHHDVNLSPGVSTTLGWWQEWFMRKSGDICR